MQLLTPIAAFCLVIPVLLAACAYEVAAYVHQDEFLSPLLQPRKLHPQPHMKSFAATDVVLHRKLLMEAQAGYRKQENDYHGGTWREWMERPNRSDYFTMDYYWVRRRRPIHNKHFPFLH